MAKKKQQKQSAGQQFLSPEKFLRERMRQLPIGKCYISEIENDSGMYHIVVTRQHTGGRISAGMFLVDTFCIGVKDSFYQLRLEPEDLEEMLSQGVPVTFSEISYEEAHNRIYGAIAFAEEGGIKPDRSFQLTQYFLEEDTDDIPLIEYEYGKDGQHFLFCKTQLEASRYLPALRRTLGDDGFKYIIGLNPFDEDDDDEEYDDDDEEYVSETSITLAELVKTIDVDDLDNYSDILGFMIDGKLNDTKKRKAYVRFVLNNPQQVANLLCEEDVWRLTELRDNPDWKEYIPFLDTSAMPLLVKYGFAEKGLKTDGTYAIHVASDFWKAIKPCLDHLSNDFGRQLRLLTETFTEGLANLYGEISRNELVSYMDRNITGLAKVGADMVVDDVFARSMLLDDMAYTVEGFKEEEDTLEADKVAFVSRYGWYDLDAQRKAVDTKKTIAQRQTFTPKEVSDAASGNLPMIPNKLQSAFEHLLIKEMGINETLVALTCHQLWFLVQHEGDPDIHITPEQFFENATLSPYTCKADDRLKAQARQLLADYLDNMPRWSLKGYSKAELAKTV